MAATGGLAQATVRGRGAGATRDPVRMVLLLAAAWAVGLAIALAVGLLRPVAPPVSGGQHARDAELAGRRWSVPTIPIEVGSRGQLAGRRWSSLSRPGENGLLLVAAGPVNVLPALSGA